MSVASYVSFGGGVQSTALAQLCIERDERVLGPAGVWPDAFVFADTGDEPEALYPHVADMAARIEAAGFEFVVVGHPQAPLSEHVASSAEAGLSKGTAGLPFFVQTGTTPAPLRRGCTHTFKVQPIERWVKARYAPPRGHKGPPLVECWLGISADESQRMKCSTRQWMSYHHPLVSMGWNRHACLDYLSDRGLPAMRSACVFCPFHSDIEWTRTSRSSADWAKVVGFERRIHAAHAAHGHVSAVEQLPFLHRSLLPIEAAEFNSQGELFGMQDECAGVCGV